MHRPEPGTHSDGTALCRRVLASAIIDAVTSRGSPCNVGLVELMAYHGGPRVLRAAPVLLHQRRELIREILLLLYERDGDPAMLDAAERPDMAALLYRRRCATIAASVEVLSWPPMLAPATAEGRHAS